MNTKKINLTEIKPYWRNPRKNDKVIEGLKESIIKFGYKAPIIVDAENVVIVGHSRLKALNQLKGSLKKTLENLNKRIKESEEDTEKERLISLRSNLIDINEGKIDVIVADDLTEAQAKEYRISDNKLGEVAEWDQEKLMFELREIEDVIGFSEKEIGVILREQDIDMKNITDEDLKKVEEAITGKVTMSVSAHERNIINVTCPHCGEVIGVNKDEINNA